MPTPTAALLSFLLLLPLLAATQALPTTAAAAAYTSCADHNAIVAGSCNSPDAPCEPKSNCFNAGKTTSLQACQAACDAHPGCVAVTWHNQHVAGWAETCVLQNSSSAWHPVPQSNHESACKFPSCACAPPPPPPPEPSSTDCVVARVAFAKAMAALNNRNRDLVFASLNDWMSLGTCMGNNHQSPSNTFDLNDIRQAPLSHNSDIDQQHHHNNNSSNSSSGSATGGPIFYVDCTHGSDSNAGTSIASAFRTLHRAQAAVRQALASTPSAPSAAPPTVNVQPGTCTLPTTLLFTAADSGPSPDAPVVWQGDPSTTSASKPAILSGAPQLFTCPAWTQAKLPSGATAYCCRNIPLPASAPVPAELFLDGMRLTRARYPNGDPLIPNSGYDTGARTLELMPNPTQAYPSNLRILSRNGTVVSTGSVRGAGNATVTVVDVDAPRDVTTQAISYSNTRFNETFNAPVWSTTVPQRIGVPADWQGRWPNASAALVGAVVQMMHPMKWGSWAFEVGAFDDASGNLTFSRGGFQEARGGGEAGGAGALYIENFMAALDAPGEWYLDPSSRDLYIIPPSGRTISAASVLALPQLPRLVQFRGDEAAGTICANIRLANFNITHAAPTYLADYEVPSGGDWSIHRGGAVFADTAEYIQLAELRFDQIGGNGVVFSNHVHHSTITDSDFYRVGDTAIALIGSSALNNGTDARYPAHNLISSVHVAQLGVYMKQTACLFKSTAFNNTIERFVCHDGPRAGINFNDGFMGGDVVKDSVLWALVRSTGDHGTHNGWDRKEWFFPCPDRPGDFCFAPKTMSFTRNIHVGPAGWNFDMDDGTSYYTATNSIVYQGGFKYRDGINRTMTNNLLVGAVPFFQVSHFDTDFFDSNFLVQKPPVCGPPDVGGLSNNTFLQISSAGWDGASGSGQWMMPSDPQKCDQGTTKNMTPAQFEAFARTLVGLQ